MVNSEKIDSLGIEKSLVLFPEQIKTTFEQSLASNIEKLEFNSVVISGMGGSSNAGKIIQSLIEKESKIPVFIVNDYGLPGFVNEKTLVILNSYSGNTEETLSAYDAAKNNKCLVIGVTTGGKIGELIKNDEIKGSIVSAGDTNPSGYPKSGLGLSLGALMGALIKVGLLDLTKEDLYKSLDEVEEIRKTWNVEKMANWLNGHVPVLFSSKSLLGPLNAGRNAICEIGRVNTHFYDFPEVNHVLIEALQHPDNAKDNHYLFFESELDHPKIKKRYEVTKIILNEMGLSYNSYKLQSKGFLSQCLEVAHYCAWLGLHLSFLRSDDPGPEPWIIKLKESLSQPIH